MDFRIKLFEIVATQLGLSKTSYDEQTQTICYDGYLHVSFADSQRIGINAICLPIASEKESIASTFCRLINPHYSYVNFAVMSEYLIAYGGIKNSIFMEDEPESELKNFTECIIQEIKSGTKHILNVIPN